MRTCTFIGTNRNFLKILLNTKNCSDQSKVQMSQHSGELAHEPEFNVSGDEEYDGHNYQGHMILPQSPCRVVDSLGLEMLLTCATVGTKYIYFMFIVVLTFYMFKSMFSRTYYVKHNRILTITKNIISADSIGVPELCSA